MIVDIGKIIVKERIRKDFGDIQELADDIQQNGLINPPVVNKEYELLAGERRLRACKSLGWKQIEIRMMDTRDGSHDFDVEVSENENRKDFTKSERDAIYLKRVEARLATEPNLARIPVERDVAKELGTSRTNLQTERKIIENKDLLSPEDFANWDEGKLSTNKAFQKIKAQLAEKDRRIKALETDGKEREDYISQREEYIHELENREVEVKVVEKKVEVMPKDYEKLKEELETARQDMKVYEDDLKKARDKADKSAAKVKELESKIGSDKSRADATRDIQSFTDYTNDYLRRYGGHVWAFEKFNSLPESVKADFVNAIKNLDGFAQQLIVNLEGKTGVN